MHPQPCGAIVLTNHDSRRHGVPLEPEGDEGARDQDDAGYEDGREVEGPIPRKYEIHLQAAIVTCGENMIFIDIS